MVMVMMMMKKKVDPNKQQDHLSGRRAGFFSDLVCNIAAKGDGSSDIRRFELSWNFSPWRSVYVSSDKFERTGVFAVDALASTYERHS